MELALSEFRGQVPGQQLFDAVDRMVRDPLQHLPQVGYLANGATLSTQSRNVR